jgi:hypothetical protein
MIRIALTIAALMLASPSLAQTGTTDSVAGKGVDARGGPVIDPTENVKALSEAANKRQDDLRDASERLQSALREAQERLNHLRYDHLKELQALRADYDSRLLIAEAKRIDAIRAVDVSAVAVASTRANDQALVLATQVSQSAEALRNLVATTASTAATSLQQVVNALSTRLTALEQAGYQAAGKQTLQDPAFIALLNKVEALSNARTAQEGIGAGRGDVVGWIVAGITLVLLFIGVTVALLGFAMRKAPRA